MNEMELNDVRGLNGGLDGQSELIAAIENASGLLRRDSTIAAIHIVDNHGLSAADQQFISIMLSIEHFRVENPRDGFWSLKREAAPADSAQLVARPRPVLASARRKLAAIEQWSAGFEGLTEGAR
jgi:hypothetical protein